LIVSFVVSLSERIFEACCILDFFVIWIVFRFVVLMDKEIR
jgi:hypothetical protein